MVLSTFWLAIGDSSKITSNVLVANSMSVLSTIAVNIDPSRGQTSRVTCGLLLIGRFHVGVLCHHLVPDLCRCVHVCVIELFVLWGSGWFLHSIQDLGHWLVLAYHSGLVALVGPLHTIQDWWLWLVLCTPFRTGGSGILAHHSGLVALVDPCTPFRTGGSGILAHHSGLVALVDPCTPFRTGGSG